MVGTSNLGSWNGHWVLQEVIKIWDTDQGIGLNNHKTSWVSSGFRFWNWWYLSWPNLVGGLNPLKNMKVKWDDDIPIYGKIKFMFQTTNQELYNIPVYISDSGILIFLYIYTGCWLTYPSEKWWSSPVGMMTFPIYGKIKIMFQTTNQQLMFIFMQKTWNTAHNIRQDRPIKTNGVRFHDSKTEVVGAAKRNSHSPVIHQQSVHPMISNMSMKPAMHQYPKLIHRPKFTSNSSIVIYAFPILDRSSWHLKLLGL